MPAPLGVVSKEIGISLPSTRQSSEIPGQSTAIRPRLLDQGLGMGNEAQCTVRLGKQTFQGNALLETSEILFRAVDAGFRLKLPFSTFRSVRASGGELRIDTPEGEAIFELGAKADKWLAKILHPKTRLEKLGLNAATTVLLLGEFPEDFKTELGKLEKSSGQDKPVAANACIFLLANSPADLRSVAKAAKTLVKAVSLWIVYSKGQKDITEVAVIAAGRKAGLKDVKVVAFSATHTALKFVLPVSAR
jgi:hypothetical protein